LDMYLVVDCLFFVFRGYGDHRDLQRVDGRQRQMLLRDRGVRGCYVLS